MAAGLPFFIPTGDPKSRGLGCFDSFVVARTGFSMVIRNGRGAWVVSFLVWKCVRPIPVSAGCAVSSVLWLDADFSSHGMRYRASPVLSGKPYSRYALRPPQIRVVILSCQALILPPLFSSGSASRSAARWNALGRSGDGLESVASYEVSVRNLGRFCEKTSALLLRWLNRIIFAGLPSTVRSPSRKFPRLVLSVRVEITFGRLPSFERNRMKYRGLASRRKWTPRSSPCWRYCNGAASQV